MKNNFQRLLENEILAESKYFPSKPVPKFDHGDLSKICQNTGYMGMNFTDFKYLGYSDKNHNHQFGVISYDDNEEMWGVGYLLVQIDSSGLITGDFPGQLEGEYGHQPDATKHLAKLKLAK